jgi:AcrR family transcriptional regulator
MKRAYVRGEERRAQIVRAALQVLTREGAQGFSMRKTAQSLGLAPSAAYKHFAGKEEILDAVVELVGDMVRANVAKALAGDGDPLERLRALLVGHARLLVQDLGAGRTFATMELLAQRPERGAAIARNMEAFAEGVAGLLEDALRHGQVRADVGAAGLARICVGLNASLALRYQLSGGAFDIEAAAEENFRLFRHMAQPGPNSSRKIEKEEA